LATSTSGGLEIPTRRGKDKIDVERIVQLQGERLDRGYVWRWLVDAVGEDDERVQVWDRYCAELTGRPR